MNKIMAMFFFSFISFLAATDIDRSAPCPSGITTIAIPMDIEQEWVENEYDRFNEVSNRLDSIDRYLVLGGSKLLGGSIPCLFYLLESSKNLEEGKRVIQSAFPKARIIVTTQTPCAQFY